MLLMQGELNRCLWCCSSAARPSQCRAEIIGTMSTLLFSRDATFRTETPVLLQTIIQALVSLLPALSSSPGESESVKALIYEVWNGGSGLLSKESIEQEFGTPFPSSDTEPDIREALAIESVLRCLAYGSLNTRAWVLHNLVEVSILSRSNVKHADDRHRNTGPSHLLQGPCRFSQRKRIREKFVPSPMLPINCLKSVVWTIVPSS